MNYGNKTGKYPGIADNSTCQCIMIPVVISLSHTTGIN